jgi:uncharacterized repeat protein (TIGR03803 family)
MKNPPALPTLRTLTLALNLFTALALIVIFARPARAQTESVLYNFCQMTNCVDGLQPTGNIVRDSEGNTYGTTQYGGQFGQGVLYQVGPSGVETVLHNFGSSTYDGQYPTGLVADNQGNLYGTTTFGGSHVHDGASFGTVFKMTPAGVYSILYNFHATYTDASYPEVAPAVDAKGNLYGTTPSGGEYNRGTIYKLTPAGRETILYSFEANAFLPFEGLTLDHDGNAWGTSSYGGNWNDGFIFEVSAAGAYSVRFNFGSVSAGVFGPESSLTLDSAGHLYGTGTTYDGTYSGGGVYKISPGSGEIWKEDVLLGFANYDGPNLGAGVTLDGAGNLYGTAAEGGTVGYGTVFELSPSGQLTTLFNFDYTHGSGPDNTLLLDSAGHLYGTTKNGGSGSSLYGGGTLFEITP